VKPTLIASIVCLIGAVSEALVTGTNPRDRFRKLRLPSYSPAIGIWILIGFFYYLMCFVILRHLFSAANFSGLYRSALVLVIAMLAGNAAWNALFFRLGALRLSFLAFVPYGMLVLVLTVLMIRIYGLGVILLTAYCGYLVYAACWSYRLWQLNDPKH
jgi:tryptophan-rich sensory protein